jgi:hypothetical protein
MVETQIDHGARRTYLLCSLFAILAFVLGLHADGRKEGLG